MSKSIFGTRLKYELKRQGYTFVSFADKLGYTEDAIKRWTRTKNPSMPNLETMRRIADILNVDMSYLIGDQECRHHQEQTIQDVTGLSQEACENLVKIKYDKEIAIIFDELLKGKSFEYFGKLLFNIWLERSLTGMLTGTIGGAMAELKINETDYIIYRQVLDCYKHMDPEIIFNKSKIAKIFGNFGEQYGEHDVLEYDCIE